MMPSRAVLGRLRIIAWYLVTSKYSGIRDFEAIRKRRSQPMPSTPARNARILRSAIKALGLMETPRKSTPLPTLASGSRPTMGGIHQPDRSASKSPGPLRLSIWVDYARIVNHEAMCCLQCAPSWRHEPIRSIGSCQRRGTQLPRRFRHIMRL